MLEALLVSNNLDCDHLLHLVIEALESLAETTCADFVQHFKTISQVVLNNDLIVSPLVIKSKVVTKERSCLDFDRIKAEEVDFWIVLNLNFFIICDSLILVKLKRLAASHRELNFIDANGRRWLLRI